MSPLVDRPTRLAVIAICLLAITCAPRERGLYSHESYLEDLARLEEFTAAAYANFEWALTEGGFDPVAAHREARRAILAGHGRGGAGSRALQELVDSFGDSHFRLRSPGPPVGGGSDLLPSPGPRSPASVACPRLGYGDHDQSFRFDLGPGFQLVTPSDDPFPAGRIELAEHRVGVVRIDEFGAHRYGEYCPEVWESYRAELTGPCDDWQCEYGFRLAVIDRLLDEISARIASLAEEGISALAVDISGNGGGSDWVLPTAMLLTDRTLVGNERSVIRHPHWQGILEEMAADLDRDLARDEITPEQRRLLERVRTRLAEGIREAGQPCDLSRVWEEGAAELPCSNLVRGKLFTTGLLATPPPVDTCGLTSRTTLFKAFEYRQRPPAWRGPLALLIDHDTASASELFAVLLRDNDAATLIGERTFGAGCGYTNGGIQLLLKHSQQEVWLPDCVRHRRGGGNERAGIAPDLTVERVPGDRRRARGERFRAGLEEWAGTLQPEADSERG